MKSIFMSASVPFAGRGDYHKTTDPALIQKAVRELILAVGRDYRIVWGGHPTITPMVWATYQDPQINYPDSAIPYQSLYFKNEFPRENPDFGNLAFVRAMPDDRDASLLRMRRVMLSLKDLVAAVFIGGMEGVEIEYALFRQFHPGRKALLVPATGGAARRLAEWSGAFDERRLRDENFGRLFREELGG